MPDIAVIWTQAPLHGDVHVVTERQPDQPRVLPRVQRALNRASPQDAEDMGGGEMGGIRRPELGVHQLPEVRKAHSGRV